MKKIPAKFKFFLINLAVALALICGIAVYVLYWLDDYTEHGTFISVPDLHDFTCEEAEAIATKAGLQVQIIDSLYDDDAQPGAVVEQYPAVGSHVKEGRMIHLTINARNPEKVMFPNLRNAAYRQTLQSLEARGFQIGKLEYVPSEFRNLVLAFKNKDEEIEPGALLAKGAVIDIVLGSGSGNHTVTVPHLIGMHLKEAISMLRKTYLNIGEIIPDGSISAQTNKDIAFVYQQTPETDFPVEQGTSVSLHITFEEEKITVLDSLRVTE